MLEITLVLTTVGMVALAVAVGTPTLLTTLGLGTLGVGLVLGLPTGFWYHVVLYRCAAPKVRLSPLWWLAPSGLHRHLSAADQRRITPWYRIGGVGFGLCLLGGVTAIAGLLMGR
jgi:hypothetical protein